MNVNTLAEHSCVIVSNLLLPGVGSHTVNNGSLQFVKEV